MIEKVVKNVGLADWEIEYEAQRELEAALLSHAQWRQRGRIVIAPPEQARRVVTNKMSGHRLLLYSYDQTEQR